MITQINGQQYRQMIEYGIRSLSFYQEQVNALNVFPVPDGDTGSNMVMTLQNGFLAMKEETDELSRLAQIFSDAVVFGARGNSGVIVSQFFKGVSECFLNRTEADCRLFSTALKNGVQCAYRAVSHPVEGTVLTVLREAADGVQNGIEADQIHAVDEAVDVFLTCARRALAHTPDMLPILRSAGVVDSGGAGIVYVFEGIQKYFRGEFVAETVLPRNERELDYSRFGRTDDFSLGYCTECLIQLTEGKQKFLYEDFKHALEALGESTVTSFENDKVKLHIHTQTPEQILAFCHLFGEFLSVKIENMSVQHHEAEQRAAASCSDIGTGNLSVVAVAHDPTMRQRFMDMGADVVMTGNRRCPPSASDFLDAFSKARSNILFVFPNHKNTELVAEQAKMLYKEANVIVFPTRADTECYSVLPMVDFETEDAEGLAKELQDVLDNIETVTVTRATQNACFDGKMLQTGEYLAMSGDRLLCVGKMPAEVGIQAVTCMMMQNKKEILTLFANPSVTKEQIERVKASVSERYPDLEIAAVSTQDEIWQMVLSFE